MVKCITIKGQIISKFGEILREIDTVPYKKLAEAIAPLSVGVTLYSGTGVKKI